MKTVTLEQVNENVLLLRKDMEGIKELLEESAMELTEDVKRQIRESRNRPVSDFKAQEEIEKKFL